MCYTPSETCQCNTGSSGSDAAARTLVQAPFVIVGGAVAVTLIVWVVRTTLPWLIAAGAAYLAFRVIRLALKLRQRWAATRPVSAIGAARKPVTLQGWRRAITGSRPPVLQGVIVNNNGSYFPAAVEQVQVSDRKELPR